jgi:putative phage-type endonuclease
METTLQHGSEEWAARRWDSVTGTDVGKILGQDPETSRLRLLLCKAKKEEPASTPYGQELMALGREFERVALEEYLLWSREWNQGKVPNLTVHTDYPWLAGTPDWLNTASNTVVELKTKFHPSPRLAGVPRSPEEIPLKHYMQVQTYMEILGSEHGRLLAWSPMNGYSVWEAVRDRQLMSEVLPELSYFHSQVEELRAVGVYTEAGTSVLAKGRAEYGQKARWAKLIWESIKKSVVFLT